MSLINRMLQDLDRRHMPQGGLGERAEGLARYVRPVRSGGILSRYSWRITALVLLVAAGWAAWAMWQPAPQALVADTARESKGAQAARKEAVSLPAAEPTPRLAAAAAVSPLSDAIAAPAPDVQTDRPASKEPARVDMPRPATEPTPSVSRPAARSAARSAARKKPAKAPPAQETEPSTEPSVDAAAPGPGRIERRSNFAPNELAESEFLRAVALVNQGRIAEGVEGLHATLKIDPAHERARQTLVVLLVDAGRVDEAAGMLREGLALNAQNTGFAMLLARIMVEHNDVAGALSVLQKHAAPADQNPHFHAFVAALYQRLDRHEEAIEQYRTALRLAPSAGIWWVGLGISCQSVGRQKEALDAFNTAKSGGSLSPDLLSFVDQRLRQLQ
jgi:MSHA biogenesis protein MshN